MIDWKETDREFYDRYIRDELPESLLDVHAHIWTQAHRSADDESGSAAGWVHDFCRKNDLPYPELQKLYAALFAGKTVSSLVFGWVENDVDTQGNNRYVGKSIRGVPHVRGLAVSKPDYGPDRLVTEVEGNGLIGLKPYPTFVSPDILSKDVRVTDMITREQLDIANGLGWVVMLHLPRDKRLADRANIEDILMIEREYPNVRLIIAHIGRAYCRENIGGAFEALKDTKNVMFDFAANTNEEVFRKMMGIFGPERVMFGTDLPISAMRLMREHRNGSYINIVPEGTVGAAAGDPHIREARGEEAEKITFFVYESVFAMVRAVKSMGLGEVEIEKIFYRNAIDFIGF